MPKGIALIIAKKAMGEKDEPESDYTEMAADLIRYVKDEDEKGLAELLEALAMKRGESKDDDQANEE